MTERTRINNWIESYNTLVRHIYFSIKEKLTNNYKLQLYTRLVIHIKNMAKYGAQNDNINRFRIIIEVPIVLY